MNKTFTTGIILGGLVILAALAIWNTISVTKTVDADHAVLNQIVQLISNSQKQAQGQSQSPAPATAK